MVRVPTPARERLRTLPPFSSFFTLPPRLVWSSRPSSSSFVSTHSHHPTNSHTRAVTFMGGSGRHRYGTPTRSDSPSSIRTPWPHLTERTHRLITFTSRQDLTHPHVHAQSTVQDTLDGTHERNVGDHFPTGGSHYSPAHLGSEATSRGICSDTRKIFFDDIKRSKGRVWDRFKTHQGSTGFHQSVEEARGRSQTYLHHTHGQRNIPKDDHTSSISIQCDSYSGMAPSRAGQGRPRDSDGRPVVRSDGFSSLTSSPHHSHVRRAMGQGRVGRPPEQDTFTVGLPRNHDSCTFNHASPSIVRTSVSSFDVPVRHDRLPDKENCKLLTVAHLTQFAKGRPQTPYRCGNSSRDLRTPLPSPFSRGRNEISRDPGCPDHIQTSGHAKCPIKHHVSFSPEIIVCVFSVCDPPSLCCSPSPSNLNCASRVLFSPCVSERHFSSHSPIFFPLPTPPPTPLWKGLLHPPKNPSSLLTFLENPQYETSFPYETDISGSSPKGPPKSTPSTLTTPLKPIVTETLDYDYLICLAQSSSLPPPLSEAYQTLLKALMNRSIFLSLFGRDCRPGGPGRPSRLSTKDLKDLLSWGVISPKARCTKPKFYHFCFKVAKSDPSWSRFIMDCSQLNESQSQPPSFSLPSPITIICTILSCDVGFVVDFASWFFQHSLSLEVAEFFALRVGSSPYLLMRLAQGWKFSPFIGHSSSSILADDPQSPKEDSSLVWIDDLFFGDHCSQTLESKKERFLDRCRKARATIGTMSEISSEVSYVGMEFNLRCKCWRLKSAWVKKFASFVSSISHISLSLSSLWALLGGFVWFLRCAARPLALLDDLISQAISLSPRLTTGTLTWTDKVELWPSASRCVTSLLSLVRKNQWRAITHPLPFRSSPPLPYVFSDASVSGGAVVWNNTVVWETKWDFPTGPEEIFYLEALAWAAGVRLLHQIGLKSAITVVDNQGLFYTLLKGRSRDVRVGRLLVDIFQWAETKNLLLFAGWTPTDNMPADAPSRGHALCSHPVLIERISISKWPVVFASDL